MEWSLPTIFWARKFWKFWAFNYNQHGLLIMWTNARFYSIGTTSGFWAKIAQNYMSDKTFEKINSKIVYNKHIVKHPYTKFQSIWGTSVSGTKFDQKTLQGGVLGQTHPENYLS